MKPGIPEQDPRVPVFLVTGISREAMDTTTMGLVLDLPSPVVVDHAVDLDGPVLVRTVSDLTGVLERERIDLAHACVHCAIREDVIPTLARLSALGRWSAIVASLPVGADATQVCRCVEWEPERAPDLRIGGVVAGLAGSTVAEDLTGEDLLAERGLEVFEGDVRGVAEVVTGLVEYADIVTTTGLTAPGEGRQGGALLRALARPGALVVDDWPGFDGRQLLEGVHHHRSTEAWVDPVRGGASTSGCADGVWVLALESERPVHPGRLHDHVELLGGGRHRGRGCFWVPSRPDEVCLWEGAGGQLSIGASGSWGRAEPPRTRIVLTGLLDHGDPRTELRAAFEACLVSTTELGRVRAHGWRGTEDGLEPWLGPIQGAA